MSFIDNRYMKELFNTVYSSVMDNIKHQNSLVLSSITKEEWTDDDDFNDYKKSYNSTDTSVEGLNKESYVAEQIAIVNKKLNALIEAVAPKKEETETETVPNEVVSEETQTETETVPNEVEDVETVPTKEQLIEELNTYDK